MKAENSQNPNNSLHYMTDYFLVDPVVTTRHQDKNKIDEARIRKFLSRHGITPY